MSENSDSATVRCRLRSGEYVLCEKQGARNCEAWTLFRNVCIRSTKVYVGYVQCVVCETLFRFKKGSSTSNLKKHYEKCNRLQVRDQLQHSHSSSDLSESDNVTPGPSYSRESTSGGSTFSQSPSTGTGASSDQSPIPTPPGRQAASTSRPTGVGGMRMKPPREVPQHVKDKVTDACVKMCAVDLRPFTVVNGPGFKHVAQSLIEVGAKCGNVNAESVLPHSTTISRKTCIVAEKVREKFLPEVKEALNMKSCAFDADLWSDKYTKTAYLTTTAQYVTKDYKLKSLVLFTVDFPAEEAKTGANILKFSNSALEKLKISEQDVEGITHVTDGGSNMKTAYTNRKRISCSAHNLATVLRHLLDEKCLRDNAPLVLTILEVGRNVVTYMKRSGLCRLLPHTVKTLIEVRWDSVVDMLMSLCDAWPPIVQILTAKKQQDKFEGWDGELVTKVIQLLAEFKAVTKELQAKKVPTIQNVVVRYHDLLEHCKTTDADCKDISALKEKASALLREKLTLENEHYIAAVLCPNVRSLSKCEPQKRELARSLVISRMEEIDLNEAADAVAPPSKKSRYGSWEDDDSETLAPEDELELYLKTGKKDDDDPGTLLEWWKTKASLFPRLAVLARRILAIPATSSNSERNFSRAGIIVNDKRSQISPENVDHSLVIHNYYLSLEGNSEEEKCFFQEDLQLT